MICICRFRMRYPIFRDYSSTTTHCHHYLQLVIGTQRCNRVLTFRNNFSVSFDGDSLARVTQKFDQLGNAGAGGDIAGLTVELDVHGEGRKIMSRKRLAGRRTRAGVKAPPAQVQAA
ncbi:hypothetical protein ASB57_25215 [Bordetella sp. N]|nr:hypothetical protein ASB57_25215 [Bordetella sp. N]